MPNYRTNFTGPELEKAVNSGSTTLGFQRVKSDAPWFIDQSAHSMSFTSGSSATDYRKFGGLGFGGGSGAPIPPLVLFGQTGNVSIRTNQDTGAALTVNGVISASDGYHDTYNEAFERDSNGDLMPRDIPKLNNEHWQITGSTGEELCLRDTYFTYPFGSLTDEDLLDSLLFG